MRALLLALALLTATPAGAQTRTPEQVANLTGPDRQKILEEGARKEGELLWVGSFNEENARPILAGFAKKYPFIRVNRVRTDSMKALHRVLAEIRARQPRTDLITSSAVVDLRAAGAVIPFKSPVLDTFRPQDRDPEGYAAPLYFVYNGLAAYNTNLVSAADAPRSYDDLLDPKWKGQMAGSSSSSSFPQFISFLRITWGENKAKSYLEKLAQQKVAIRGESARTVLGMIAAGEHKIMINPTLAHVGEYTRKGAPVEVLHSNPTQISSTPVLFPKGAPRPHAAMLLIDYLLDLEAQGMLRDAGYFPANHNVELAPALKRLTPASKGFDTMNLDDNKLGEMYPGTSRMFKELFE